MSISVLQRQAESALVALSSTLWDNAPVYATDMINRETRTRTGSATQTHSIGSMQKTVADRHCKCSDGIARRRELTHIRLAVSLSIFANVRPSFSWKGGSSHLFWEARPFDRLPGAIQHSVCGYLSTID